MTSCSAFGLVAVESLTFVFGAQDHSTLMNKKRIPILNIFMMDVI